MSAVNPPSYLQQRTDHTAAGDRQTIAGLIGRVGVGSAADMLVTQNSTPNMSVHVAAGSVFVMGADSPATQGIYHCFNDGDVALTISTSDPTNPRNDLVVARVRDAFYTGATNAWDLTVVQGTPAASPVDPVPSFNNYYTIARVRVNAGATSITTGNITDLRLLALAVGAPGVYAEAAGTLAIGAIAGGSSNSGSISFPSGRFTQPPIVTGSIENNGLCFPMFLVITTTGANVRACNAGTGTTSAGTLYWHAVQMTLASSSG